jgi:hypothetical protein
MIHSSPMHHGARAYILGAIAFLGLLVAVGRPLLKLHDEASWRGHSTPVFAIELLQDAGNTHVPVVTVP